jgi:hypothetical protein
MGKSIRYFGHDGPTPYLIRHQECHTAPLTRLSLVAIALRFVCYVSRRHVFSAYTIMCRDPTCRDAPLPQRRYVSFSFPR